MDGTYNMYGGNEKTNSFRSENIKGRGQLKGIGIDG
jgi:hypothetical protein